MEYWGAGRLALKRCIGVGSGPCPMSGFAEPSCSTATLLNIRPPQEQITWPVGFLEVLWNSSVSARSAGSYSAGVLVLIPGGCFRGPAIWQQSLHPSPPIPSAYSPTPPPTSPCPKTFHATWSFSTLSVQFLSTASHLEHRFTLLQSFFGLFSL
jgi:hypothetical protein